MSPFLRLFAALTCLLAPTFGAELRILKLEPTVFFANREPLQQLAWLHVENPAPEARSFEALLTLDGAAQPSQTLMVPPGPSRQTILIPDLPKETPLKLELRADGVGVARLEQVWKPQRKWMLFVVKSSHEDIGYENFLWLKQKEIADFIDLGRQLSSKTQAASVEGARDSGGYRYWLETLLFPRYYAEERGETALRDFVERDIKSGNTPLAAAPSGIHPQWMDYEELVRTTYPGRRDLKDRFGLDLDTFAIVDNPSFSWSLAQVLAGAGIKYAVRFGQPFRTGGKNDYASTKLPAIFWWEGPDGKSRVLFTWRHHYGINFWFGQTSGGYSDLSELASINVQRELGSVQEDGKLGPYPWDALLIPSYQDHEIPQWDNRALRRWGQLYRYPEIRVADPRDFMAYMEKTYGPQLPVLRGEMNNYSADYATIDPEAQGWKRRAARVLPQAEGFAAVAGLHDPSFALSPSETAKAYQRMFDFAEHSWPTSPPPGVVHQFNAQWGKRLEGKRALDDSLRLLDRALGTLCAQVPTGSERELLVANGLAHVRSDIVFCSESLPALVDPATGLPVATQRLSTGETVFVAKDLPAFGYKTYRLLTSGATEGAVHPDLRAEGTLLENEYYTIRFDPKSGAVTSIYDRELRRELVDTEAAEKFNQIVYVSRKGKESREGKDYSPTTGASLKPVVGPVAAEMIASFRDEKLGGATVVQTLRLYGGLKRIDIVNDLRHVGVLYSGRAEDRYRHNLFYAFPFKVENFTARAEYAGGVVRPYMDQLRWGSHDFLSANRWVDLSNSEFGVTLALHNAPVVHFGAIRYNEFSNDYRPERSHLFSFAWSNRMAGLFALSKDEMNNRFAYSITSHSGNWDGGAATRFGWQSATPLESRWLRAGQTGSLPDGSASFVSLDAPNVQLTVLKESEQPGRGWILRLVETDGRPVEFTLDLSALPVDAASLCDLVENDLTPASLYDGRLRLKLGAFAFATLRAYARQPALPSPESLRAEVDGDSSVRLRWAPVSGAQSYHIYRSVDPKAPPTAHTFVARCAGTDFADRGLTLDTAYWYRVAAVAPGNVQGAPSETIQARTGSENLSPPSPVGDFGVVRQAKDRLLICWERSPEPDVARYYLYRSERPDFDPGATEPIAVVEPSGFYLEHYFDRGLQPGRNYHYRVYPEDWAGNRQTHSPLASGNTPKDSP